MKPWKLILLLLIVASFALTGCSDDDDCPVCPDETPDLAFVGSSTCGSCHGIEHDMWEHSGHPYKLTKIEGESPVDQFPMPSAYASDPVAPPAGTDWSDFSYTIGGFAWKMRWIQTDGYIYTPASGQNQYNFENQTFSDYHAGESKPYNCGACHTTGWVDSNDGEADNNQDGMEGFHGTFFAGGVHCEKCHGMGSQHASDPDKFAMTTDNSSEFCGKCHTRGGDNGVTPGPEVIEASYNIETGVGFIKHHEQYDEWYNSAHNSTYGPGCNDCHNPHASVVYDDETPGEGVSTTTTCVSCHVDGSHADIASTTHSNGTCLDCHMPKASKSAIAVNNHVGDVNTHLWKISTSVNGKSDMFSESGTSVALDEDGYGAVSLEFACYGCHSDPDGVGGDAMELTLEQLAERATTIHTYVEDKVAGK